MKLRRLTHRKVGSIKGYGGVCNSCGSPINYKKKMLVIILEEKQDYMRVVPIDAFYCPFCGSQVTGMMIYKNLNVTKEFESVKI